MGYLYRQYYYLLYVSEDDLYNRFRGLESSFNSGPFLISLIVLKSCKDNIIVLLIYILNLSLKTGEFIDEWTFSYVSLIYKSGSWQLVENYRAIAKLSCISKVLEIIVNDKLFCGFKNMISIYRNGFFRVG